MNGDPILTKTSKALHAHSQRRDREPRRGIGTVMIVMTVIIVILIGTVAFMVLSSGTPSSPDGTASASSASAETSSTRSGGQPTMSLTASASSASGLALTESINASTITVGQRVNVSVSIQNTRPGVNTVLPSDEWSFKGVPVALWPPCYFGLPAEMVVLNGSYTVQDLQRVANTTFSYQCMEAVNVDHVIFQPDSDEVNLTGVYDVTRANQTLGPFHTAFDFTTAGYWDLPSLAGELNSPILGASQSAASSSSSSSSSSSLAYTTFSPGVYTIAVADEWGQAAVLYVTVLPVVVATSSVTS